jgi:hypothetical protein
MPAPAGDGVDNLTRHEVREIIAKFGPVLGASRLGVGLIRIPDNLRINPRIHDLGRRFPKKHLGVILAVILAEPVINLPALRVRLSDPKAVSLRAGHMLPAGPTLHADGLIAGIL